MAVRDRTILDNSINLDQINQDLSKLQSDVDTLSTGNKQSAKVFETELERDTELPNPEHGDWCYVLNSSVYNATVQYIYNSEVPEWKYVGTITNVNDATTETKGIIKLAGDLSGTASSPQLKSITTSGTYAFGNNTVTVDSKGRISNVITSTTAYEWVFNSKPDVRTLNVQTLTVPSYDIDNATLLFFYNGFLIPETDNYTRLNSTTLTTNFIIYPEDDITILNIKFIGKIDSSIIINDSVIDTETTYSSNKLESDFAKINDDIIPTLSKTFDVGSAEYSYKDGYFYNSPIITSMRSKKKDIANNQFGLEFVNAMLPRTYKMQDGVRMHSGFVADEIKSAMDLFGVDFGVYVKDKNGNEALRYEELIPIMCKAIQDLTPWYKKLYYKIKRILKKKGGENK